jgi:hypothetical protein
MAFQSDVRNVVSKYCWTILDQVVTFMYVRDFLVCVISQLQIVEKLSSFYTYIEGAGTD